MCYSKRHNKITVLQLNTLIIIQGDSPKATNREKN